MYNSTIKTRVGKCRLCTDNIDKKLMAGLCINYHYKMERAKIYAERQRERNKIRSLIPAQNKGKVLNQVELNNWFKDIEKIIEKDPHCWETGDFIYKKDYRSATAHILPKSLFPSISTHPMNYLILSPRNGSHDKTHRLDTFSKMKCFDEAVRRFKLFEDQITEHHKLLDTFKYYANKL